MQLAHQVAQHQQRYEQRCVSEPADYFGGRPYSVYALFDGHNGDNVSQLLANNVCAELNARLPTTPIPEEESVQHMYADHLRRAVLASFLSLALAAQQQHISDGSSSQQRDIGCCATACVIVQTGSLLTVANVGNTRCVLDVGHTSFECTSDHKLGNNEDEEDRLDAVHARVARLKFDLSGPAQPGEVGCGPLRIWPGGLHMSRAIGSFDCGPVIPHPYIQQVWLPRRASRLIVATGSVWDAFETFQKAAGALRDVSLPNAAGALLRRALQRKQHLQDKGDLSVLVVDVVPDSGTGFRSQMRLDRLSRTSSSSNHSAHSNAVSLRRSHHPKPPANLSVAGMQALSYLQQQQQHRDSSHDQNNFRRHSYAGTSSSSAAVTPALSPSSSSKSLCSSNGEHSSWCGSHQQQHGHGATLPQPQPQQQFVAGLFQRLLPHLCFGPPAADSSSRCAVQQQPGVSTGIRLQQLNSFGSSTGGDSAANTTTASSARSSGSSSWRSRSRPSKAASNSLRHIQEDSTAVRIVARCDTFNVYFGGVYQPLEKQLAMVDSHSGWTVRPSRSLTDLVPHGYERGQQRPVSNKPAAAAAAAAAAATPGAGAMLSSAGSSELSSSGTFVAMAE